MKRCARCKQLKDLTEFPIDPRRADRLYSYCKQCKRDYMKAYRRAGIAADPDFDRKQNYRRNYGITVEEYDRLLAEQGGVCKICKGADPKHNGGRFLVDHDHETGGVRGLLCGTCNFGLGAFQDDAVLLGAAIEYLSKEPLQIGAKNVPSLF